MDMYIYNAYMKLAATLPPPSECQASGSRAAQCRKQAELDSLKQSCAKAGKSPCVQDQERARESQVDCNFVASR